MYQSDCHLCLLLPLFLRHSTATLLLFFPVIEIGEIKEVGASLTFFWSGHKPEQKVGFATKSEFGLKL